MTTARRQPTLMFGIPIDDLTLDQTIDAIGDLVDDGRAHGRHHQVATVNVDFLVNALHDPAVRTLLQDASLNLADGVPLVWGARLAGLPIQQRVAGADLVPELAAVSAARNWKVHFFGSAPEVAERALEIMLERSPDALVTGSSGPMMPDITDIDDSILDGIAELAPDILCVALGNPKQERFIAAHGARLKIPVMIGIGGSLDMLVGDKKRAPEWAQRVGAEWVFRAAQEPRRLGKRYAKDALVFGPRLVEYLRILRRHRSGPDLFVEATERHVTLGTREQGASSVGTFGSAVDSVVAGSDITVDLAGGMPNPDGLAQLIGVLRVARRLGRSSTHVNADQQLVSEMSALSLPAWVVEGFSPTAESS